MPLADPRNREIDFDFDFDSFVRAGGAKLRGCVGDVILIAGAPAVKFSGSSAAAAAPRVGFAIVAAICMGFKLFCDSADSVCCYMRGFFGCLDRGEFLVIYMGFNTFWYFCMLCVAICVGFKHYSYDVIVICMGFKSYSYEVTVICMGFKC